MITKNYGNQKKGGKKKMGEEKSKEKFIEHSEKYRIEALEYSEKQDRKHKLIGIYVILTLITSCLLVNIGIIFLLDWVIFTVIIVSLVSIIILIIDIIHTNVNMKKREKKWNEYVKEIENLLRKKEVKRKLQSVQ